MLNHNSRALVPLCVFVGQKLPVYRQLRVRTDSFEAPLLFLLRVVLEINPKYVGGLLSNRDVAVLLELHGNLLGPGVQHCFF